MVCNNLPNGLNGLERKIERERGREYWKGLGKISPKPVFIPLNEFDGCEGERENE